jgi:hypothetical protein
VPSDTVFLNTQPGWAFATLAELRALGIRERVEFCHRDSTLILSRMPEVTPTEPAATSSAGTRRRKPRARSDVERTSDAGNWGGDTTRVIRPDHLDGPGRTRTVDLVRERLRTPAEGYLTLAMGTFRGEWDATRILSNTLRHEPLRDALWEGLETLGRGPRARAFSVTSEVWGRTAVERRDLADLLRWAVKAAFPKWEDRQGGGVRLLCKADTNVAVAGLQVYANLDPEEHPRPGTLREHLAYGLLAVAGLERGGAVLDPFMGSGSILRAAALRGAEVCIGAEVDRVALRLAEQRVNASKTVLVRGSFESLDLRSIPDGIRLVSNLPFGVQFEQVPSAKLRQILLALRPRLAGAALLMARDQAAELAPALDLRIKHVIVLGQPAAIAYSDR